MGSILAAFIEIGGVAAIVALILGGGVLVERVVVSRRSVRATLRVSPADRAEALLRAVLDEGEYRQLTRRGYLDVTSPTHARRIYRVPACAGLVRMYEDGVAARELCIQPVEPLPSADVVVMHKLMIQGAEQEYLARARQYATIWPKMRYRP